VLKELILLDVPKLSMGPNVELKIEGQFGKKPRPAWLVVALLPALLLVLRVAVLLGNVCQNIITVVLLLTIVVKVVNLDLALAGHDLLQLLLQLLLLVLVVVLLDNACQNMAIVVLLLITVVMVAELDLALEGHDLLQLLLQLLLLVLVDVLLDNACQNIITVVLLLIIVVKVAKLDLVLVVVKMLVAKLEDVVPEDNVVANMVIVELVLPIVLVNVLVMNQLPNMLELFPRPPSSLLFVLVSCVPSSSSLRSFWWLLPEMETRNPKPSKDLEYQKILNF